MDLRLTSQAEDARLATPDWQPPTQLPWRGSLIKVLIVADVVLAARYMSWLLTPGRLPTPCCTRSSSAPRGST
jgi:hypothetical protein